MFELSLSHQGVTIGKRAQELYESIEGLNRNVQLEILKYLKKNINRIPFLFQDLRAFLEELYAKEFASKNTLSLSVHDKQQQKRFINVFRLLYTNVPDNLSVSEIMDIIKKNQFAENLFNIIRVAFQLRAVLKDSIPQVFSIDKRTLLIIDARPSSDNKYRLFHSAEIKEIDILTQIDQIKLDLDQSVSLLKHIMTLSRVIHLLMERHVDIKSTFNMRSAAIVALLQCSSEQFELLFKHPDVVSSLSLESQGIADEVLVELYIKIALCPFPEKKSSLSASFAKILHEQFRFSEAMFDYMTYSNQDAFIKFPFPKGKTALELTANFLGKLSVQKRDDNLRVALRLFNIFSNHYSLTDIQNLTQDERFDWRCLVRDQREFKLMLIVMLFKQGEFCDCMGVAKGTNLILWNSYMGHQEKLMSTSSPSSSQPRI